MELGIHKSSLFCDFIFVLFADPADLHRPLYDKAKKYAETAGYSSVDEFVTHMLEKEITNIEEDGESLDAVQERLRGLGYIS